MKTTQNALRLLMFLVLATGMQNCKKSNVDTQLPSIVFLEPNAGDRFASGADLTVVATFHDYVELGKYRIVIKWNTDPQNVSPNPQAAAWDFTLEEAISGNNKGITKSITVPLNVRLGGYELILYCYDKAGNEISKSKIISIGS